MARLSPGCAARTAGQASSVRTAKRFSPLHFFIGSPSATRLSGCTCVRCYGRAAVCTQEAPIHIHHQQQTSRPHSLEHGGADPDITQLAAPAGVHDLGHHQLASTGQADAPARCVGACLSEGCTQMPHATAAPAACKARGSALVGASWLQSCMAHGAAHQSMAACSVDSARLACRRRGRLGARPG